MLLISTSVAPLSPEPNMLMTFPGCPKDGEKLVMDAAHAECQRKSAGITTANCRTDKTLLVQLHSITFLNKIADHRQFLFTGNGMRFDEFTPLYFQPRARQQFNLRARLADRDERVLRPVRHQE